MTRREEHQLAEGSGRRPSFAEAFRFWLKLGFVSFGGPAGQIAIMQTELVEKKRWISQARFLHALNFCMLLPGPEAQQLAIYVGWLLHKTWGGIVAGALGGRRTAVPCSATSLTPEASGKLGRRGDCPTTGYGWKMPRVPEGRWNGTRDFHRPYRGSTLLLPEDRWLSPPG